jgi:hypothetical protein
MINLTSLIRYSIPFALIGSTSAFAAAVSGTLVVFNGLANLESATGIGYTASPIKIQVYDTTGLCNTTNNVAYNGLVLIPWATANTHTANICSTIASVTITPLAQPQLGVTIYGASTAVPATGSVSFTVPTTLYSQMVLIPVGRSTPITAADATHWGNSLLGVPPTFNSSGGELASAGVPGVSAYYGIRARQFMMTQGLKPYLDGSNNLG